MSLSKAELDAAIKELSSQIKTAPKKESAVSWLSLGVAAFAAVASASAAFISNGTHKQLEDAKVSVQAGQARMHLVEASVLQLERMVTGETREERNRACHVALEMGLIESEFGLSQHILTLHQKYLNLRSNVDDKLPDLCEAKSSDALNGASFDGLNGSPIEAGDPDSLASRVVVMASYRGTNCAIAQKALKALVGHFEGKVDGDTVKLALSRSQHYAVVYSPFEASMDINDFLTLARAEGRSAQLAIAEGSEDPVLKQNVQYVSEAYVAGTEGWSLVGGCPK